MQLVRIEKTEKKPLISIYLRQLKTKYCFHWKQWCLHSEVLANFPIILFLNLISKEEKKHLNFEQIWPAICESNKGETSTICKIYINIVTDSIFRSYNCRSFLVKKIHQRIYQNKQKASKHCRIKNNKITCINETCLVLNPWLNRTFQTHLYKVDFAVIKLLSSQFVGISLLHFTMTHIFIIVLWS